MVHSFLPYTRVFDSHDDDWAVAPIYYESTSPIMRQVCPIAACYLTFSQAQHRANPSYAKGAPPGLKILINFGLDPHASVIHHKTMETICITFSAAEADEFVGSTCNHYLRILTIASGRHSKDTTVLYSHFFIGINSSPNSRKNQTQWANGGYQSLFLL